MNPLLGIYDMVVIKSPKKSALKASHCPVWDKLAEGGLRKEPFPSQCCVF